MNRNVNYLAHVRYIFHVVTAVLCLTPTLNFTAFPRFRFGYLSIIIGQQELLGFRNNQRRKVYSILKLRFYYIQNKHTFYRLIRIPLGVTITGLFDRNRSGQYRFTRLPEYQSQNMMSNSIQREEQNTMHTYWLETKLSSSHSFPSGHLICLLSGTSPFGIIFSKGEFGEFPKNKNTQDLLLHQRL